MATLARVTAERVKPARGMSLGELQRFLDEAFAAGFAPDTVPTVTAGFRLGLQKIEVSGEVNPP